DHGARASGRHAEAVAGRRRGAGRREDVFHPRRHVPRRRCQSFRARRQQPRRQLGRRLRHRPPVDRVHVQRRERARRRATVARPILGAAWPQHMNKTVAETMYANIVTVGLPKWDEADVTLAKGIQRELKQPQIGLATEIGQLRGGLDPEQNMGGPSDDIGDVSWNVPTVTLSYPANIPNLPGHNWANAIAMATPIAHKGVTAGAKVQAMTI